MDLDTTARKGAHRRILQEFAEGKADILLGTQMVAKGLDFPHVTLVGVISADTQMLLPDFRSSERTFQLLTQVAGRAGRSTREGEVMIQTLQPEHYSLRHAQKHDVEGFYAEELEYRRELSYPPFSRLVLVELRGEREAEVIEAARIGVSTLAAENTSGAFSILGPAEAAIPRLRGRYRYHLLLKGSKERDPGGHLIRAALRRMQSSFQEKHMPLLRRVQMILDVDPQSLL
jgi:primosomal protein N' (replication factor Y)